jgi:hypothetical protein
MLYNVADYQVIFDYATEKMFVVDRGMFVRRGRTGELDKLTFSCAGCNGHVGTGTTRWCWLRETPEAAGKCCLLGGRAVA